MPKFIWALNCMHLAIRLIKSLFLGFWYTNYAGNLYPTKEGISLKEKDWKEFLKYSNMMYSERLELYSFIPCLIQPKQDNHNPLLCQECSHLAQGATGEVLIDVPCEIR